MKRPSILLRFGTTDNWGLRLMDRLLPIPFLVIGIFIVVQSSSRIPVMLHWIGFLGLNLVCSKVIYWRPNLAITINIFRNVSTCAVCISAMRIADTGVPIWLMVLPMLFATPFEFQSYRTVVLTDILYISALLVSMAIFGESIRSIGTAFSALAFISVVSMVAVTSFQKKDAAISSLADKLAKSNRELEQFAYVASHDLQEPLRMVASYLKLIERRYKEKLDKDGHEFIDFAVDGAKRMQRLIQDLLSYSRVGTKAKPFAPTECEAVYKEATKNLKVIIEEHKANVNHDSLPKVSADKGQLIQLFQNLIGNALKFCKNRTPDIHVSAKQDDKNKNWIFGIKDNGIGIASEYQERIFQIFQRLHTRDEYEGTGIGLAVCKKIVERHGGKIWIESEVGKGTTFWFTVPIRNEDMREEAST